MKLDDAGELVPFSRWITPRRGQGPVRHALLPGARAPARLPRPDGDEIVDVSWFAPAEALERHAAGEFLLVFPTIKQLEALLEYGRPRRRWTAARSIEVEPILPARGHR